MGLRYDHHSTVEESGCPRQVHTLENVGSNPTRATNVSVAHPVERHLAMIPPPPIPSGLRDTNAKGTTTEATVLAALTSAGYRCYVPFGVSKADLIIETAEGLRSVQCKTAKMSEDGSVMIFRPHTTLRSGLQAGYQDLVDLFAVATPSLPGRAWIIPVADVGNATVHLRFSPPLNGRMAGIRMAEWYEIG